MYFYKKSVKLFPVEKRKPFTKNPLGISRACSKCGGDLGDRYGKQRWCLTCHAANMRDIRARQQKERAAVKPFIKNIMKLTLENRFALARIIREMIGKQ